jgi:hypothetical protein
VVDAVVYTLPEDCPFHPRHDLYVELEEKKKKMRAGKWKCISCDKLFIGEEFIDKHIYYKHHPNVEKVAIPPLPSSLFFFFFLSCSCSCSSCSVPLTFLPFSPSHLLLLRIPPISVSATTATFYSVPPLPFSTNSTPSPSAIDCS